MHAHNSSSIERRPQFGSLTRSWIWIRALRMAFSSSLELGYVVLGLFFSLPQLAFDLTSTPKIPDSCRQRSSISLTAVARNHVEHSFRKARQLWTLSKLPSPCHYFEKRKKNNNKAKVFQHPIDSQSASCSLISRHVLSARAVGARPRCSEFLSNRKYRYRSYTQTDDTHCWPWSQTCAMTPVRGPSAHPTRPPKFTPTQHGTHFFL